MNATLYAEKLKKLPTWIYKPLARMYFDGNFPRHLFIETTANCNLACEYCPREDNRNDMPFELFKRIIDEASRYGRRSFSLHLFGEPLLYPRILDSISYIKKKNRHHAVLLTTNGTHLNRYVDDLIKLRVDEIIWTWRREAKFRPETIQKLRHGKTVFRVRIIQEITPEAELQAWKTWPNVEIRSLHNYGGNVDLSRWFVPPATTRWPCYHLWFAPAVAWNGNMLLCCADPHQREVIGNVKTQTISSMWKDLEKIRESHKQGKFEGICKECDVWKNYPSFF